MARKGGEAELLVDNHSGSEEERRRRIYSNSTSKLPDYETFRASQPEVKYIIAERNVALSSVCCSLSVTIYTFSRRKMYCVLDTYQYSNKFCLRNLA